MKLISDCEPQGSTCTAKPANKEKEESMTLYVRLGGNATMSILLYTFVDELMEQRDLRPFYKRVAFVALKSHFISAFRLISGSEGEQPSEDHLVSFLLTTHTRLFRDHGLNGYHFDLFFLSLFVRSLQAFQVDEALIVECQALLSPLRSVFEFGAKLAFEEKCCGQEQVKNLPDPSESSLFVKQPATSLYSFQHFSPWLPGALSKNSEHFDILSEKDMESKVRKWTCDLTNRFATDNEIAAIFLQQPFMDHHPYLVAFLELAFRPNDTEDNQAKDTYLQLVLYPLGRNCPKLSRRLYDRMIVQFLHLCSIKGIPKYQSMAAEEKLRSHSSAFGQTRSRQSRRKPNRAPQRLTSDAKQSSIKSFLSLGLKVASSLNSHPEIFVQPKLCRSCTEATRNKKKEAPTLFENLARIFGKW